MDSGSIIIGAIFVALCIVPFILIQIGRNKRKNQKLKLLHNAAKEHNCVITQYEFEGDFLIGIDEINNYVFFSKYIEDTSETHYVDLATVQKCEVIYLHRTYTARDGEHQRIAKLELAFIPNPDGKRVIFEFYNEETSMQIYGELQAIQKWSKLLNDRITAI